MTKRKLDKTDIGVMQCWASSALHSGFLKVEIDSDHMIELCERALDNSRLAEENVKLRQEKENLLHELCSIQNACIGQITMGYNLDAERIGHDISVTTGMTNPELNKLLNQLKDQNNDK